MENPALQNPSLDAHAHVTPLNLPHDVAQVGAVLGMSLSLDEADSVIGHQTPLITWGVGCHPRFPKAQAGFDIGKFKDLACRSAIVGEIGLDTGSRVPLEIQLKNFRQILEWVAGSPRIVSIHSYQATGLVLRELHLIPIKRVILHWWTGSAEETSRAVELGCYFSVHSQVARQSKFRTRVPADRILVESDHGYNDPPPAIPCRIQWVEYLVAQQLKLDVKEVRRLAWRNLASLVEETGTGRLLPGALASLLVQARREPNTSLVQGGLPGIP